VIPRVVGILAIIFAAFGAAGILIWTIGPISDIDKHHLREPMAGMLSWFYACAALSIVIFGLHLAGGIMATIYKFTGLRLLTLYGVLGILVAIADLVLVFALMPDHVEGRAGLTADIRFSVSYMRAFFDGLALVWPVIVLALVNTRGARAACT